MVLSNRERAAATIVCALVLALAAFASNADDKDAGASQGAAGTADAAAIREHVIGNTVVGTMAPDSDYAEYYAPDGTIHGADYQAEWQIKGGRMCFVYDQAQKPDCYAVRIDGKSVEWHLGDETRGTGTIAEGNPNNF